MNEESMLHASAHPFALALALALALGLASCRPAQKSAPSAALATTVATPEAAATPAQFTTYCTDPKPHGPDVERLVEAIRTGPNFSQSLEQSGGAVPIATPGDCAAVWKRFLQSPRVDFEVAEDVAALAILKGVPRVQLFLMVERLPKSAELLTELDLRHLDLTRSNADLPSADERERLAAILGGLSELDGLGLRNWRFEELTPIAGQLTLTTVQLTHNGLKNIDVLFGLANLRTVILDGNPLGALLALKELPNLKFLSLKQSEVVNLAALKNVQLETLDLTDDPVVSLEPLRNMPLRDLTLDNTKVVDLTPLVDLPKLEVLRARLMQAPGKIVPRLPVAMPLKRLDLLGSKLSDFCKLLDPVTLSWVRLPNGTTLDKAGIAAKRCP